MRTATPIGPVLLEGRTIQLRPMALSDVDALCAVGLDPGLWKSTMTHIVDRAGMERYVRTALEWQEAGTCVPFVTVVREGAQVVGSTRFANIDRENRRAEIGWTWIARPWQRTAVNTEAKFLMLRQAFEVWGVQRVELKTATFNEQSRNAIARIGGRQEGIFRKHMILPDGRVRDSVYYSIIDDEWVGVKQNLMRMLERGAEGKEG